MVNQLNRFLTAQEQDYDQALSEIRSGRKRTHWIWYIFPQIQGLGFSTNAVYYSITDLQEAAAFLKHPVLGRRLVEISRALLALSSSNPTQVMGSPDDIKLRSSMTLFSLVPGTDPVFGEVLEKFFGGVKDDRTVAIVSTKR
ncbi:DUF1810 domain-containing protein [Puia sp. P3]|uniref:DUF1810 domain-containing protein n=1 Tax=Puia sp. P3 TaxID=3423952 RepID=UPI003D66A48D